MTVLIQGRVDRKEGGVGVGRGRWGVGQRGGGDGEGGNGEGETGMGKRGGVEVGKGWEWGGVNVEG